jgi:hypothetical protein
MEQVQEQEFLSKMKSILTKYKERLETYTAIVDYFAKNPAKIPTHISRLEDLQTELLKPLVDDIDVSDEDIQDKARVICMKKGEYKELADRLNNVILGSVKDKLGLGSAYEINSGVLKN